MATGNKKKQLEKAQKAKDDEFYTLYEDISAEVPLYKEQLKGKRILCPCDWDESYNEEIVFKEEGYVIASNLFGKDSSIKEIDIAQSKKKFEKDLTNIKCNFVKFLVSHADDYGIKSVSVSGFNPKTEEGIRFQDIDYGKYDVVITNPPFSQFREFIDVMFAHKIEFLVIGPQTAISYKDIFPHIKNNEMWLGYHHHLLGLMKSDGTLLSKKDSNLPNCCCWFTNLDVSYRHDRMILTEEYSEKKYPKYDNLDGIDVNKTKLLPNNYDGVMGVPITFMQKYNPEQFEIVGFRKGDDGKDLCIKDGKPLFIRILIRKR